jgi:AsmA protein
MRRLLKFLLWLLVGLIAFFAVAAVALYVFFDPNDFREDISELVKNRTGRDLTIEGDISLDLFPWLAIEVGEVSLGDAPGFGDEPIATFERASLSVRLLPVILRQELIVGAATIDGLRINLKLDSQGVSNWSSLIAPGTDATSDTAAGASDDLNINRIDIRNATLHYSDAQTGDVYRVGMDLHIGHLRGDAAAVPVDGELHFELQPVGMTGDVSVSTLLSFDADAGTAALHDISLDGEIEGLADGATKLHFSSDAVVVNSNKATIAIQPIDLELLGLSLRAQLEPFSYENNFAPHGSIQIDAFSPRELMVLLDIDPPATADPTALTRVVLAANARLTSAAVELTEVSVELDDTTFHGALSVPRDTTGVYRFELSGDSIDLNRYMAPAEASATGTSQDTAPIEIPTQLIKSLNGRGTMQLGTMTLGDIILSRLSLALNASGGRMRLFPMSADLYGGTYNGDVQIDASGSVPSLSVNEKIQGVDLAKLVKAMYDQDNVTGTIDGSFSLSGKGADLADIQRSLAGTMSFELRDGSYQGTDIWYELRRARAQLRGTEPPQLELPAKTSFGKVQASGVVSNGVLRNDDLYVEIPHIQLTGSGTVNLALATLDYRMTARVLERPELLADTTPEELDEFTEAVIPLKISGPLASPSVKPDLEKLLRQRVEDEIKDRLEDKLKDLFKR